ncbi:Replication-associated recombination protein A [bioreactor metagenome]|uniref:Replication-associated recombination protein A n=1 Tax=bioreactor metagenome TaxID=1076179 RepID=A0A645DV23_9ZZZZ
MAKARAIDAVPAIEDAALDRLIAYADGDARRLLNTLETLAVAARREQLDSVTDAWLLRVLGERMRRYDKGGEQFYDTISALHKSVRGSDPDAALYWLARMLEGGDDVRFITRRLCIFAAEDVGLADPMALVVTQNAAAAVDRVGMPEANLILGEAVIYLASAPKSNSAYLAIKAAQQNVREGKIMEVPSHLRNDGEGYVYPHDSPNHWVPQAYMPEVRRFYFPGKLGAEARIEDRLKRLWKRFSTEAEEKQDKEK